MKNSEITKIPRVAIQGIKASFHEEAAFRFFGDKISTLECKSFKQTFEKLYTNEADFLVVAIENSIAGSLLPNYGLLMDYHFPIFGEVYLPIRLHLMSLPGVDFESVKYVTSHPIALRQCLDFFDEYPQLQIIEGNDTAACARKIRDEKLTDTVTVASSLAAEVYGLQIIERRIESNKKNYTRFLILSGNNQQGTAQFIHENNVNKASLCFQVGNQVGALARVLNIFAENSVNMSKIQSMPVQGKPSEYLFHVDVDFQDPNSYEHSIRQVLKQTHNFNILGEYSKGKIV